MTTDAFIRMTRKVIADQGFENYLPTLVLPIRRTVIALENVSAGVDIEIASRQWAAAKVDDIEDFYLAFKVDHESVNVIARRDGVETLSQIKIEP
jgi:hypothetical protein